MGMVEVLARRMLFRLDPETAHRLAIRALAAGLAPRVEPVLDDRLHVKLAGLDFPNPVGVAAGFDKNAEVPDALARLGFGFVEVGTVTPLPQPGNPRPRIFRLQAHDAVINRLGFNNAGHAALAARMASRRGSGIVGINIGANKASADFVADYEAGIERLGQWASYFTVNVSSPNTPGLRDLQAGEALRDLLARVLARRDALPDVDRRPRPVFLKIAPDLDDTRMDDIAAAIAHAPPDAVIVSNTTVSRHGVEGAPHGGENGGLSGRPLFERSTIVLARMRQRLPQTMPLIGVGGVADVRTAIAKFAAGASLVQLYTGMIYAGPGIAADINRGLVAHMDRQGFSSVADMVGTETDRWAAKPLPPEAA